MGIFAETEKQEETLNIWQMIRTAMNAYYLTPQRLSTVTNKSVSLIKRGLNGEPIDIDLTFFNSLVRALGYGSGREGKGQDYSWDEMYKIHYSQTSDASTSW